MTAKERPLPQLVPDSDARNWNSMVPMNSACSASTKRESMSRDPMGGIVSHEGVKRTPVRVNERMKSTPEGENDTGSFIGILDKLCHQAQEYKKC